MGDWILFAIGLGMFLVFSFALNAFFLGTVAATMKRYLLGRIIGGTIRNSPIDHEATHRALGLFGLHTRDGGPGGDELARLRPKHWQESLAWICYVGIGLAIALMIYAKIR